MVQSLASLIPNASGWSGLNATGINDAGQIVGQGLIDVQEHAFLMTPIAEQVPEPGAMMVWGLGGLFVGAVARARRRTGAG